MGLKTWPDQYIYLGMQKRVGVARTIAIGPVNCLMLDTVHQMQWVNGSNQRAIALI